MHKILKLTKLAERLLKEIENDFGIEGEVEIRFHSWPNDISQEEALRIGNALAAIMDGEVRNWERDNVGGVNVNERGKVEITVFYRLENESLTISDLQEAVNV